MQIYEGELHVIDDTPTFTLAKSSYKLKTEDAERISVDQVGTPSPIPEETKMRASPNML